MKFDYYTLVARLLPTYLVILPLVLLCFILFPDIQNFYGILAGIFVPFGVTVLLAQIGRDAGKQKESWLFSSWGGIPTNNMLSNIHSTIDKNSLKRYHQKLEKLIPGLEIPTEDEERGNPDKALQIFQSCTKYLRENTRDLKKFNLIFSENVNYGFRRNLWGMKREGACAAYISSVVSFFIFAYKLNVDNFLFPIALIVGVICLAMFLLWMYKVNPKWIKIVADAYAERLICALDVL